MFVAFPAVIVAHFLKRDPTVIAVMITGATGGFISLCRRIYEANPGPDPEASCRILRSDRSSLVAKPLFGAVFALVLYLLFLGGIVSGSLFPAPSLGPNNIQVNFQSFLTGAVWAVPGDFAKLLVWCFIAGFAERFVPDILGRLGSNNTIEPTAGSR